MYSSLKHNEATGQGEFILSSIVHYFGKREEGFEYFFMNLIHS